MTDAAAGPERTALRVALWRALHVQIDPAPHVLEDEIGLKLAGLDAGWRKRGDMNPRGTLRARASIIARARFIEDLVVAEAAKGVDQYVILGAGLDSFAQRRPPAAAGLTIFEVDQPAPQAWKQRRLAELGYAPSELPRFTPVDFEAGASWWDLLVGAGFDPARPAVVASAGVALYLTREAVADMLTQLARLAAGSTLVSSFMLPVEAIEPEERAGRRSTEKHTKASGQPFLSVFTPAEMLALATACGFKAVRHVSAADLAALYFAGRSDGLRPSSSEEILVAST